MAKTATKKAASKKELAVAQGGIPAEYLEDMSAQDGAEDFGAEDLQIPQLKIVQALSPQMKRSNPRFLKDAQIGQIVETVTPQLFEADREGEGEGILVIVCKYDRTFAEWAPERGGKVAEHGPEIMKQAERTTNSDGKTINVLQNGNEVTEAARYAVCRITEEGELDPALLFMQSTQWKKARDWNTRMKRLRVVGPDGARVTNPMPFCGVWRLTTGMETKDDNEWYGWNIEFHDYTLNMNPEFLRSCMEFRKIIQSGAFTIDDDEAEETQHREESEDYIPGFDD